MKKAIKNSEIDLSDNAKKAIDFFCEQELQSFKESDYFVKIKQLCDKLGFLLDCFYEINTKSERKYIYYFLCIDVRNQDGEFVEVDPLDHYTLGYSTVIAQIDRKDRVRFLPWFVDDDFIESVEYGIQELQALASDK